MARLSWLIIWIYWPIVLFHCHVRFPSETHRMSHLFLRPGFQWLRFSLTDRHLRAVWLSCPWNRRTFCYGEFLKTLQQMQGAQLCLCFFHPIGCAGSCEPVRYMHFSFLAVVGETATTKFHRTILAGWQALMCDSSLFSKVTMHWWVQLVCSVW